MNSSNTGGQGVNIFTRNQPQTTGNMFSNQSQGQGNNIFSSNRPQTGMFNNNSTGSTTPQNSMFNNSQSQGGGNTLFNNQQQGSSNLFNNRPPTGTGNNLFNQGSNTATTGNMFSQGGTTLFSQPTSNQTSGLFNNNYNQYGSNYNNTTNFKVNPNCPVNEAKVYELLNTPIEKQRLFFETFQPEYLKQLITYYRKSI
jgi:hypothetical protein